MKLYVLDKHHHSPVEALNFKQWRRFMVVQNYSVDFDKVGDAIVCTRFLGLDPTCGNHPDPMIWESKVYGYPLDIDTRRCSGTKKDAEAMHEELVTKVLAIQSYTTG